MASPFPGMDPYLEAHWGDVHTSLTLYARDLLQPQLPRDLRARVEEYLSVESDEPIERHYVPDVRIIERPELPATASTAVLAPSAVEPLVIEAITEPRTLRSIRIVDTRSGNRIVTGIEFLSPANKLNRENRRKYRAKRKDLLDGRANVVEIDLTRRGRYLLAAPNSMVPPNYRTPYRVRVIRAAHRGRFEIYRLPLEQPLPTIRVPLRPDDPDVLLNLQELIARAWQQGSYDDIDYSIDPDPPLRGPDAAWAETLLRSKGLRASS